jgi:hypothetical protein
MSLPRRSHSQQPQEAPTAAGAKPADGAFQSMDQIANWVRFADTKATILVAGLGVVLTMIVTNSKTVISAINKGDPEAGTLYTLSGIAVAAFVWTLTWLLVAIGPRRKTSLPGINRFAWPTLTTTDAQTLIERDTTDDVREDAWRQVVDLSQLAAKKFAASNRAIWGFGILIVTGAALVIGSIAITYSDTGTATQDRPPATTSPQPAGPGTTATTGPANGPTSGPTTPDVKAPNAPDG